MLGGQGYADMLQYERPRRRGPKVVEKGMVYYYTDTYNVGWN
jgi:hypothetical protein